MPQSPAVIWFRDDLRLADHAALDAAARSGRPLVALYVLEDPTEVEGLRSLGGATLWWLGGALRALSVRLETHGVRLLLRRGPARECVPQVARQAGAGLVVFNHRSGAGAMAVDREVTALLQAQGCAVLSFPGHLLHEPGKVVTQAGSLPRTFAAFQVAARRLGPLSPPLPAPVHLRPLQAEWGVDDVSPDDLEPHRPDWAGGLRAAWTPGEIAAQQRMSEFLEGGLRGYAAGRDIPGADHISRLSPHLRFGEISPRQILHALYHHRAAGDAPGMDAEKFEAELYWREFSHHLLFAFPQMTDHNLQRRFDAFPWRTAPHELEAWQQGCTGYPLVDAGMRELWQTGWMHNRVRMVVASFLSKHLLQDWRAGEAWFWDTLVDADIASNPANWQWVAGTGMDAAPYFRIFNPVLQGEKFDPEGTYVRRFVPELSGLPTSVIHKPWAAGAGRLKAAGIRLGETYPEPIVDHAMARARALEAFQATR
ncbi:cryptochrome/photolyase family protein [Xanthobacter sp. TB0139]|uniref:cryptochrome/photolyase family protein n=1 Tax=Xanthobacter sp. TB0139 TaxID=3459178 RepID=UPI00403A2402